MSLDRLALVSRVLFDQRIIDIKKELGEKQAEIEKLKRELYLVQASLLSEQVMINQLAPLPYHS